MALFDQQQEEEQPNQLQPYGVCVGSRRVRTVQQRVPYVPDINMGRPLFRARQLLAHPVREQQQHVMLQDRISQDVQHNIQQDNIAYNRRLYDDPQTETTRRRRLWPFVVFWSEVGEWTATTRRRRLWPFFVFWSGVGEWTATTRRRRLWPFFVFWSGVGEWTATTKRRREWAFFCVLVWGG